MPISDSARPHPTETVFPAKHSLLRRQLKRHLLGEALHSDSCAAFLAAIDEAYQAFDADRAMVEHSLELSSQELLQANSEMRALFQAIPDLLFRVNAAGVILSATVGAPDDPLLLSQPVMLVGQRLQETVLRAAPDRLAECLSQALATGRMQRLEFECRSGAESLHYEARVVPALAGEGLVIVRNITEQKKIEETLRAEEERFRLVALATRDAIYDWDLVLGHVWRNEAHHALFSKDPGENDHDLWWERQIHPDDAPRIKQGFADCLYARERIWAQEYRFRRVDGGYATVIDRGYLLYDAKGKPLRMIGAMTDISERKRLEEQFLQSQKMDAIGQLAGGVAHDFNNLLTVIQGNLSLLTMGGLSRTEEENCAAEALRASQRAANLTRQLLTFSRREPIELKPIELNQIVAEMTRMFQRLVGEHIVIQTELAPGDLQVLADAGMMEQLLMNLVVNSRDAMPLGGRVRLETASVTFGDAVLHAHPQRRAGAFVRLAVTDSGCGIAADQLGHIFEPFYTTKEAGKGTGLGLATVFGIVQQHNGWIEVASQLNVGTRFDVYLPHLAKVKATTAAPLPPAAMTGGRETILLVEDEEMVRKMMQKQLERQGYRVHAVESGVRALDFYRTYQGTIDLLLTDMVMPGGVTGLKLGDYLTTARPGLKVLYCSGYTDEFLGPHAPHRDKKTFLAKPFDVETLLRRVRERLDDN